MFVSWMIAQVFSCFFMMGLIWIIQLIHYPAFEFGDYAKFPTFHKLHVEKIGLIVAPIMGLELVSAGILLWMTKDLFFTVNFISVVLLWVVTAWQMAPLHDRLSPQFDLELIRQLVLKNWTRTFLWSFRSMLLTIKLYDLMSSVIS